MPPVAVCHHVSTIGLFFFPTLSLYQCHASSFIGSPTEPSTFNEDKSYLSNDSLKAKMNFYNIRKGVNLFYAAYNIINGDLLLENNQVGDGTNLSDGNHKFIHLKRLFYDDTILLITLSLCV